MNVKSSVRRYLLRLILTIPRARRRYHTFMRENRLFGAPVSEEKLWNYFKRNIVTFSLLLCRARLQKLYERNLWIEIRTIGVRARVRTMKPIKPTRKFIITLINLPQSARVAERCIESAKRYGEHHELEIAPAVDKFEAMDFFNRHGFTWYHTDYNAKLKKDPLPEMGCFASHYKLWKRCIELEEPIIVLEHDAVFRAPIPPLRFKHVIMLSRPAFIMGLYQFNKIKKPYPREIFYPFNVLTAAHCYAITPAAAEILVDAAHRQLIIPADSFICKNRVDILYFHPYLVDFDFEFSTIDARYKGSPTPNSVWSNYKMEA